MTIDSIGSATQARAADSGALRPDPAPIPAPGAARAATPLETSNAVKGAAAPPSMEQVTHAVAELNQSRQAQSLGLEFSIDTDSKRTIVKVVDQNTKEVLRQIPTVEALEIAKSLDASMSLLSKQTA